MQHCSYPQNEKVPVFSDCDSDRADMDYEEETGHVPARMLNAYAELMQTDHDRNNIINDDDFHLTTYSHWPLLLGTPVQLLVIYANI